MRMQPHELLRRPRTRAWTVTSSVPECAARSAARVVRVVPAVHVCDSRRTGGAAGSRAQGGKRALALSWHASEHCACSSARCSLPLAPPGSALPAASCRAGRPFSVPHAPARRAQHRSGELCRLSARQPTACRRDAARALPLMLRSIVAIWRRCRPRWCSRSSRFCRWTRGRAALPCAAPGVQRSWTPACGGTWTYLLDAA